MITMIMGAAMIVADTADMVMAVMAEIMAMAALA